MVVFRMIDRLPGHNVIALRASVIDGARMVSSPHLEADMLKAAAILATLNVWTMSAAQAPAKVDFGAIYSRCFESTVWNVTDPLSR